MCFLTCSSSFLTPSGVAESAGAEMAFAPGWRLGWRLSAATASSQADAFRDEMKTLLAPA